MAKQMILIKTFKQNLDDSIVSYINNTHSEKLFLTQFSTDNDCLAASDLFHMLTQSVNEALYISLSRIKNTDV